MTAESACIDPGRRRSQNLLIGWNNGNTGNLVCFPGVIIMLYLGYPPHNEAPMKACSLALVALILFLPGGVNVSGNILGRDGKPLVNAKVVYTNAATGRKYVAKTDKKGNFVCVGVFAGYYEIVITDSEGGPVFSGNRNVRLPAENQIINHPTAENILNVDLSTTLPSVQTVDGSASNLAKDKLSKEELELVRQENANAV